MEIADCAAPDDAGFLHILPSAIMVAGSSGTIRELYEVSPQQRIETTNLISKLVAQAGLGLQLMVPKKGRL